MKSLSKYVFASAIVLLLSSCSEDKQYTSLPVFEIGVSNADELSVGNKVILTLTNKNNPKNIRYNSYIWACSPEVDGLESATPNSNNFFVPLTKGKHKITVQIDASTFADGDIANDGKTITAGETTNTYKVSVLKTYITVERSFVVR